MDTRLRDWVYSTHVCRHSLDAKPGKDLLESFRMSSVAFYFEGENALCTHTWLCARNRIQGFVHAFRALCTQSGICARRVREMTTPSTSWTQDIILQRNLKLRLMTKNNDRILVNRMSSLWFFKYNYNDKIQNSCILLVFKFVQISFIKDRTFHSAENINDVVVSSFVKRIWMKWMNTEVCM